MSLKTRRQSPQFIADRSMRSRVSRWWLSKPDAEQRAVVSRALMVSVCLIGLTFALPTISSANTQKEAEADLETACGNRYFLGRCDWRISACYKHDVLRRC